MNFFYQQSLLCGKTGKSNRRILNLGTTTEMFHKTGYSGFLYNFSDHKAPDWSVAYHCNR